ncbi:MAG: GGDEF domain-containing protein, partial [Oscillospiraceae bacterium]
MLAVGTSVWANDAIAALRTVPGAVTLPALGMMTLLLLRCDRKMRGAVRGRERYELLSRFNNEYLFEYDMAHDVLMLPQASAEFFGLSRVNAGFLARSNPAQQTPDNPLHAALCGLVGAPAEGVRELHCQLPDGRRRWLRMSVKVICERETPAWLVGKVLDIQRERETQERLLDKAQRDSLTNLYNAAISRQLVTAILQGAAEGPSGALMMLDVDRFKEVNDRWGHPAGDRLLIEVAQTLRAAFRSDDVIGRMGGDEFLVFMREVQVRSTVEEKCNML